MLDYGFLGAPIAIFGLSGQELLIIGLILLLLFGGAKIPQLMRGLGKGMGEFQKGIEEGKREMEKAKSEASLAAKSADEEPAK
jgi:sec-independent protein translocase protein TatA